MFRRVYVDFFNEMPLDSGTLSQAKFVKMEGGAFRTCPRKIAFSLN